MLLLQAQPCSLKPPQPLELAPSSFGRSVSCACEHLMKIATRYNAQCRRACKLIIDGPSSRIPSLLPLRGAPPAARSAAFFGEQHLLPAAGLFRRLGCATDSNTPTRDRSEPSRTDRVASAVKFIARPARSVTGCNSNGLLCAAGHSPVLSDPIGSGES